MNFLMLLLLPFLLMSCIDSATTVPIVALDSSMVINEYQDSILPDSVITIDSQTHIFSVATSDTVAYPIRTKEAEQMRLRLLKAYTEGLINLDSVARSFEDFLVNKIMPHWYGTPWDYEGHTNIPGEGEIACGYLVSTTLRHMNVQINRYHLAQQAASNGAKSLAINFNHISTYSEIEEFEPNIKDGLYMVGLSYHVGYLLKKKEHLYFIHSNYMGDVCVMIEDAHQSEALNSSSIYLLVRIGNPDLMKAWLNQEQVKVYRQ